MVLVVLLASFSPSLLSWFSWSFSHPSRHPCSRSSRGPSRILLAILVVVVLVVLLASFSPSLLSWFSWSFSHPSHHPCCRGSRGPSRILLVILVVVVLVILLAILVLASLWSWFSSSFSHPFCHPCRRPRRHSRRRPRIGSDRIEPLSDEATVRGYPAGARHLGRQVRLTPTGHPGLLQQLLLHRLRVTFKR